MKKTGIAPESLLLDRATKAMKTKLFLSLISICVLLCGCATYYNVRLNGYKDTHDLRRSLTPGATLFVLENKNAANPILEKEIKAKIEKLLTEKGFRVGSQEKADFYLSFIYTVGSGRIVSNIRPVYHPPETGTIRTFHDGGSTSTSMVTFPGYTAYVPYRETEYTSSLVVEVMDAGPEEAAEGRKQVWILEAASTSQNPDLRETVNYLLVGAFEHFGENTGKSIEITIPENDRRVADITK